MAFAQKLEPVTRERAEESVIKGWIRRDPEGARGYVEGMTGGSLARVGKRMAESLAMSDPTAAKSWIDEHLTGRGRADAIAQMLKTGATRHPEKTAAIAAELPPGATRNEAFEKSLQVWYRQSPDKALSWVDLLDDGHEKELAAKTLISIADERRD